MGFGANENTNSIGSKHNIFGSWVLNLPSDGTISGGSGGSGNSDDDGDDDSGDDLSDDRRRLMNLRAC